MSTPTHNPRDEESITFDDWERSDRFHNDHLIAHDPALAFALENSAKEGLQPAPIGAKKIIEVRTLGGYAAIWMVKALPADGELIAIEISAERAKVARDNIETLVIEGAGIDVLATLGPNETFDMVFVDAESGLAYFQEAKRLLRKGGIIIVDNVVRNGEVANPNIKTSHIKGVRKLPAHLKTDNSVDATTIATVGEKGFDGFLYAYKV
ncbi:hypothetical protein BOTBODRAFT_48504 [Botryobasidium botryosum FD-172 SS1]|uniref:O-methyltransferase domain-containing protein n=1 Tax=Botryobasidium botryosum (strain FD-172 SS1) TaxID=930990 RepID=A0A067M7V4_BOTB1|nr:hypothetical protein BOTBODRAFT_48504 [Botryobasidium botryosum FD-172 SS1]